MNYYLEPSAWLCDIRAGQNRLVKKERKPKRKAKSMNEGYIYGQAPLATAKATPPELLPEKQLNEMRFEMAVFSHKNHQSTIANMRSFGEEPMKRWFPQGLPKAPERKDFGLK